jgi:hypothetical protein
MRKTLLLAAAIAVSTAAVLNAAPGDAPKPAAAPKGAAAPAAAPAAPKTPSPEEVANIQRAVVILRGFNLAFESKEVQQPVKGQLLSCLYNNKLSTISSAAKRVLDQNPDLKADDAGTLYRVAAGVCGITFKKVEGAAAGAATPPAGKAPAPAKGNGEGR